MQSPIVKIPSDDILVTGASGFVGQHLVAELSMRAMPFTIAPRNLMTLFSHSEYERTWVQSRDLHDLLNGVSCIIHLAARVHIMHDRASDPLAAFRSINVDATVEFARQAAKVGIKRFVYVSSVKVNGEFTMPGTTYRESDVPHPQDAYAISKWEAEQALHVISKDTDMEIVIVRPPLVYGPHVKANFAKLLQLIDTGLPLPFASIQNSRSLLYVGNLVSALITCARHPAAINQTYLFSDGEDVSTPQLINLIAHCFGKTNRSFSVSVSFMRHLAKLAGKLQALDRLTESLVIDHSKARQELGWIPPYSLIQGLQSTVNWYQQAKGGIQS